MAATPSAGKPPVSPIKYATEILTSVTAGRNLNQVLSAFPLARLSPQDRGAVRDISYGALRFKGTLTSVLAQLLKKSPDDKTVDALLLAALYQLTYTEAAPYAVVDKAVSVAPQRFKALVNAVLRNFLRNREALLRTAAQTIEGRANFPAWWVGKLQDIYPQDVQAILDAAQMHPPMTLRVNRRKSTLAAAQAELSAAGFATVVSGPWALTLEAPAPVEKLPGFLSGRLSVQDAGAQWAADLLDVQEGQRVLDACAAPGGKTGHILESADASVVALDADQGRLHRVKQNLDRLELVAELKCGDAGKPETWWDDKPFDRILADVPCSASGVTRRNPDIKWQRQPGDIRKFAGQQAQILDALWQTLAPGGKLLYATCSIFPEENQQQMQSFLARHEDATSLGLPEALGSGQLLPDAYHDGFFYALLQRR